MRASPPSAVATGLDALADPVALLGYRSHRSAA
jgi:hypothetical protein